MNITIPDPEDFLDTITRTLYQRRKKALRLSAATPATYQQVEAQCRIDAQHILAAITNEDPARD